MRVHHIAIQVADLGTMKAFYGGILGMRELVAPREDAVWFALGESILMLELVVGTRTPEDFATSVLGYHVLSLAIDVSERARWKTVFHEHDIRIERETPYSIFVRDPEGNRLALSHYPTTA